MGFKRVDKRADKRKMDGLRVELGYHIPQKWWKNVGMGNVIAMGGLLGERPGNTGIKWRTRAKCRRILTPDDMDAKTITKAILNLT